MGIVYKAWDTRLRREVAIKMLIDPTANADAEGDILNEARLASSLTHPNIVTVYEVGSDGERDFIVMEYVPGQTLDKLIPDGGMPVHRVVSIGLQICDGLARAHSRGIIHRDLKPSNIILSEDGVAKILDFGLASAKRRATMGGLTISFNAGTEDAPLIGTLAYMSPEQARGSQFNHRTDIFSFGAVLYEMLTGRVAFERDSAAATLGAILNADLEPACSVNKAIPVELARVIDRCCSKGPEDRWQTVAELKSALSQAPVDSTTPSTKKIFHRSERFLLAATLAAAGFLLLTVLQRDRDRIDVGEPSVVPFTSFVGQEMFPSFSWDGGRVAFVWSGDKQDNYDIYVSTVDSSPPLRITSDPLQDFFPVWSPDDRYIAFLRGRREVFVVPSLGGPERRLTEIRPQTSAPGLAWSPDGKHLAVVDAVEGSRLDGIYLIASDTGEKRRITDPPSGTGGDRWPVFSPSGDRIAFRRHPIIGATHSDIYIVRVSDSNDPAERITFDDRDIEGLDWAPDGRHILFSSNRGGFQRLWAVRAGASGQNPPVPHALGVAGDSVSYFSAARRANRLAYVQSRQNADIWRMSVEQSPTKSDAHRLIASTHRDSSPQYSRDGSHIAFASDRSGYTEIWTARSDGSESVQITSFRGVSVGSPRWSPDGTEIAFDSTKEGTRDIFVVNVTGGVPRRLTTESSHEVRPSWSSDGRWIYYGSTRTGDWQIWRVPRNGGQAVQVTRNGGREAFESFDGQFVYYAKPPGIGGIWRVPPPGGSEQRVLDEGGHGFFSMSEQGIFYLDLKAPALKLFSFAEAQTRTIQPLPEGTRTVPTDSILSVSSDGKEALFVSLDPLVSDIVLLDGLKWKR